MASEKTLKASLSVKQSESWTAIQDRLIERLWDALVVLAVIGAPASVSRSYVTGWLPAYSFHVAVAILVLTITIFRESVPSTVKASLIVALLALVNLTGLLHFGLLSQAGVISVVLLLLFLILFERRVAIFLSILYAFVMLGIVFGFVGGYLEISFNANAYASSVTGWLFMLLGVMVFGFLVVTCVSSYRDSIHALLVKIEVQRDEIAECSTHDQLTGLPTLRLVSDRLEMALNAAKRTSRKVAVMFIDLDGFKKVNDVHGHAAGDVVLIEVARRLNDVVRTCDTVSRIGGDEFIVILVDMLENSQAAEVAGRIIEAIGCPILFKSNHVSVGCSVGIAVFPDHAADASELKRLADTAMYAVKRHGKNNFAFCNESAVRQRSETSTCG